MKLKDYHIARYISLFEDEAYKEALKNSLYNTNVYIDLNDNDNCQDFQFKIYADNGYEDEITLKLFNEIMQDDLQWLSASQNNNNGCSRGGFDFEKDLWWAHINLKNGTAYHYENVSHRKVAMWLEDMQEKYDLH